MKSRSGLIASLLLALACGCTTVQYSTNFADVKVEDGREPIAAVEIENSGWKLLGFIPLASGDTDHPGRFACRFFTNTVRLENNMELLARVMKRDGTTEVANLTSRWTDEAVLFILLKRRACHTSAILLKPKVPEK